MQSEVHNMDCMEYMRTLPDKAFQLAIADPPYGLGADNPAKKPNIVKQRNGSLLAVPHHEYSHKDWDARTPDKKFFDELRRVSKNQIIWGANYFGLTGGMVVWDKLNGDNDQYDCEIAYQSFDQRTSIVYYIWAGMMQGAYAGRNIGKALIQKGNKQLNEKRIHPTQKPVLLYAWLLDNFARKGDRIFDPMMGSQSSRIAAYKMGFDYVGCELDAEYFSQGCERFDKECLGIESIGGVQYRQASFDW